MPPFSADPFRSSSATPVDPALTSFADEVCAAIARLFAYVGTLALIGILAVRGCDQLLIMLADAPEPNPGWTIAHRSDPAAAVDKSYSNKKTEAYPIFRHPPGGGRNVMRVAGGRSTPSEDWLTATETPRLRGPL